MSETMAAPAVPMLLVRQSGEWFALDLRAAEEVLEMPALTAVPDMPPAMLGVFALRGRFVPVVRAHAALGVAPGRADGVVLIVRCGGRRVGLALDDVEDVITVDPGQLHRPPADAGTPVVIGVERRGSTLVGIVDAAALVEACAVGPNGDIG